MWLGYSVNGIPRVFLFGTRRKVCSFACLTPEPDTGTWQIHWLQDRFPEAEMQAVPGLCRVVTRAEIEAADWSLPPGRYVGVAPPEVEEDFDFEQTLKDIHLELADLNREAVELAARIQENFEELGV